MVAINETMSNIDIRAELEPFEWVRPRWTNDKLMAASPFRYDRTPSFFVNLVTGGWKDSGAVDPQWTSGGLVKLLTFLRHETYEETTDYLRYKYSEEWDGNTDKLTLSLSFQLADERKQTLDMSVLDPYKFRHPYLAKRGISEGIQRKMRIGYDKASRAATIPWFTADGRLANVKYRRTDSKIFWYYKGGIPLRGLVYGIDQIYKDRSSLAVLVEGEIDAMYCMTAGFPAVAIGGSAFTEEKADVIKRSPIERLLIATDNDGVGRRIREDVKRKLAGAIELADVVIPNEYKDVNDVKGVSELHRFIINHRLIYLQNGYITRDIQKL